MVHIAQDRIEVLEPNCDSQKAGLPRLGLIALATDLTFERDAARLIGWDEAVLHTTRIRFANPTTSENLRAMGPDISGAASLLVPGISLCAVAFACTAASVTLSNEFVGDAIAGVLPDVPVVTPSMAGMLALETLGAKRIGLLTPYLPDTTAPMVHYFETGGLDVVRAGCFGLADDRQMARLNRQTLVDAATSLDDPAIDALFMSCTALPALDVIEEIEARLDKPVVCSNQAVLWMMRGHAGLDRPACAAGRLFEHPAPVKDAKI